MIDTKSEFVREFICRCKSAFGNAVGDEIESILCIVLNQYDVSPSSRALTVNASNPNEFYIRQFLAIKMVKGLSKNTLNRYKGDIMCMMRIIPKYIPDIDANDIRYFLAVKAQSGCTKTTVNNYLLSLRTFFSTLFEEELIKKNPTLKISKVKEEKKVKKPFSDIEIEKIRNAVRNTPREKALIELFLATGCRVGEVVGINRGDVVDNRITVTGKGSKQRTVYLTASAVFAINEYIGTRTDDEEPLFVGKRFDSEKHIKRLETGRIEEIIRNIGNECGIDDCHPHRFRRTMATKALRNGMPIEQVSRILGHEQLTTTQIYARSEDSDIETAHRRYVR